MSTLSNPLLPALPALARRRCLAAVALHDARHGWRVRLRGSLDGNLLPAFLPVAPPAHEADSSFRQPEAAEQAGFRACRRCHPRAGARQPASRTRFGACAAKLRAIRTAHFLCGTLLAAHRTERRSFAAHVSPGDGDYAAAICGRAARGAVQIRIAKGERRDHRIA